MNSGLLAMCLGLVLLLTSSHSGAEIKVICEHRDNDEADASFNFKTVPRPAGRDLATAATFSLLDGEIDSNSPGLDVLHDGKLPRDEDEPGANFFFRPGTDGGRLRVDLGGAIEVRKVNTFSWHAGTRGAQVYRLFAAGGKGGDFNAEPRRPIDPETCGWKLLGTVDTRPKEGETGGQYGASVFEPAGNLGSFRYLLLDISRTEDHDPFGNTFYSEIDVISPDSTESESLAPTAVASQPGKEVIEIEGYQIRIDSSNTPDLTEWAHKEVGPMAREWYPKLAKLLASEGFEPPQKVSIVFDGRMRGVAATSGSRVRCAGAWFRSNLKGEALGAVFHELVHVIQQYGRARRAEEGARRPPGWLVEGIADYVRWYIFEPQSHGAEITRRNLSRARYDGNYRITANFLNWTTETYYKELVPRLNAAIRLGKYREGIWKDLTGHSLEELGAEWKSAVEKQVEAAASSG